MSLYTDGQKRKSIAVIGGGVSGIVASYLLQRTNDVTLIEAASALGGHTHTVEIRSGPDAGTHVDSGFIVLNNHTYPLFHKFLRSLNVAVRDSDMSFAYSRALDGMMYAGTNVNGLFADRKNLFSPSFFRMLNGIRKFCIEGQRDLSNGSAPGISLGDYVSRKKIDRVTLDCYLYPMVSAIWSAPQETAESFPAEALLEFFRNHGLLSLKNRPTWQTVVGGSHTYVKAFQAQFPGTISTGDPVLKIRRNADSVTVTQRVRGAQEFDAVVIATHSDQALRMLGDPTALERELLGAWNYQRNIGALHTDTRVLPERRRAWASWNVREERTDRPAAITYWMNLLQGLTTKEQYLVTFNSSHPLDPACVVEELDFLHPVYTLESLATQARLAQLQSDRTFFCGSYFGYGFHEDAVRSAVNVGALFGQSL